MDTARVQQESPHDDRRSCAGRRGRRRGKSELCHFTFWTLNSEIRKKDGDAWLILTRHLVGEPDHPRPTIAPSSATLRTGATTATAAARKATMTPATTSATATSAAASTAATAEWTSAATTATAGTASLAASAWSWLGSRGCECVVLHIVIADLNTLAFPGVNVVLPTLRTLGVYQLHQRLGRRHQLGVYPDGGQVSTERLFPCFGSCIMFGKDQLGIRSARKTTLHFGLEALVSVLDC